MPSSLFESSTIGMLEQVVSFTQARHGVLAGNIANLDTPGYKTRDLSPERFQESLKEALSSQRMATPDPYTGSSVAGAQRPEGTDPMKEVREVMRDILYHDGSDVSLEKQVAEISKNQAQHNLAVSIMTAQFRLLRTAISERVV